MNHGAPEIEIGDQNRRFQLGLSEREVDCGEGLAFGRRSAGDDDRVQVLLALHVVQAGSETAKLFTGNLVRPVHVDQMGFRRGPERDSGGEAPTPACRAGLKTETNVSR